MANIIKRDLRIFRGTYKECMAQETEDMKIYLAWDTHEIFVGNRAGAKIKYGVDTRNLEKIINDYFLEFEKESDEKIKNLSEDTATSVVNERLKDVYDEIDNKTLLVSNSLEELGQFVKNINTSKLDKANGVSENLTLNGSAKFDTLEALNEGGIRFDKYGNIFIKDLATAWKIRNSGLDTTLTFYNKPDKIDVNRGISSGDFEVVGTGHFVDTKQPTKKHHLTNKDYVDTKVDTKMDKVDYTEEATANTLVKRDANGSSNFNSLNINDKIVFASNTGNVTLDAEKVLKIGTGSGSVSDVDKTYVDAELSKKVDINNGTASNLTVNNLVVDGIKSIEDSAVEFDPLFNVILNNSSDYWVIKNASQGGQLKFYNNSGDFVADGTARFCDAKTPELDSQLTNKKYVDTTITQNAIAYMSGDAIINRNKQLPGVHFFNPVLCTKDSTEADALYGDYYLAGYFYYYDDESKAIIEVSTGGTTGPTEIISNLKLRIIPHDDGNTAPLREINKDILEVDVEAFADNIDAVEGDIVLTHGGSSTVVNLSAGQISLTRLQIIRNKPFTYNIGISASAKAATKKYTYKVNGSSTSYSFYIPAYVGSDEKNLRKLGEKYTGTISAENLKVDNVGDELFIYTPGPIKSITMSGFAYAYELIADKYPMKINDVDCILYKYSLGKVYEPLEDLEIK